MAAEPTKGAKTSKYALRKAARLRGRPMASRAGQPAPWYCWPISASALEAKIGRDAVSPSLTRWDR